MRNAKVKTWLTDRALKTWLTDPALKTWLAGLGWCQVSEPCLLQGSFGERRGEEPSLTDLALKTWLTDLAFGRRAPLLEKRAPALSVHDLLVEANLADGERRGEEPCGSSASVGLFCKALLASHAAKSPAVAASC